MTHNFSRRLRPLSLHAMRLRTTLASAGERAPEISTENRASGRRRQARTIGTRSTQIIWGCGMTAANGTTNGKAARLFDADEVRRAIPLFMAPGQVLELRALEATTKSDRRPHTATGYYDDADALIGSLSEIVSAKGIYITANPVKPELLARAKNRIKTAGRGELTSDHDITQRRLLLIDTDAQRPAGISSSDVEHDAAIERAKSIATELHYNYGWPDPITADSGNGGHLLYRIDLPIDDGGLVEKCLKALAEKFSDDVVKVDTSVHNPARIWKLYGTLAAKGDNIPERPHRLSRVLSVPDVAGIVPRELLEALASESAPPAKQDHRTQPSMGFSIDSFITRHSLDVGDAEPYQGGRRWIFNQSPLCEHHSDGPFLIQFSNGALAAGCHHDSCNWKWPDVRAKYEPKRQRMPDLRPVEYREPPTREVPKSPTHRFTFGELRKEFPTLRPAVIEGVARQGETVNVISTTKIGKTCLVHGLIISEITQTPWLNRFNTSGGRVLLLDNELHESLIVHRVRSIAEAMGIRAEEYEDHLEVWPLRGRLQSLNSLAAELMGIQRDEFSIIVWDSKYRFAAPGSNENDNSQETQLYNLFDEIGGHSGAVQLLVHHSSKGSQSDKRTTDVGSGAGSQSRATDCHLILREHEEPGVAVLEAALRSFAPIEPMTLRWQFPIWIPDNSLDHARLRRQPTASQQRQQAADREGMDTTIKALRAGRATARKLRSKTGFGEYRQQRMLDLLTSQGHVTVIEKNEGANSHVEYQLSE